MGRYVDTGNHSIHIMRHALSQNPFLLIGLAVCLLCFALPFKAGAQNMQGGTYQVQGGTFGTGGTGSGQSENYRQSSTFGEPVAGDEATSESHRSRGGAGGTFTRDTEEDEPTVSGGGRSNRTRANGNVSTATVNRGATSTSVLPFTPSTLGMPTTPLDNRDTEVDFPTAVNNVDDTRSSDSSDVSETNELSQQDNTSSYAWYLWLALILLILVCFVVWKRRKAKG